MSLLPPSSTQFPDPEEAGDDITDIRLLADTDARDDEGNEILGPFTYDWRNPVARATVRRIR